MMFVYRKMRESGVVVSIDGHGADELLGGYHDVLLHAWADCNFNLAKAKEIHQTFKECFFFNSDKNFRIRDYIRFMMGRKKVLLAKYTYRPVAEKLWGLEPERRMGEFNYALYQLYTKTVLPTLLRNYDRYSMASGIEVRMPMMDWRLATYSMALPWTAKLRGGYTKAILRDAAAVFSPRDVIYRKSKIGYSAPVHRWLNGIWKNDVIDLIFSQDFLTLETIDAQAVHKKYGSALANGSLTMNEGFGLWQALCPYFWEKAMLKPKNEFVANYEAV
jgi:asparagine synthase (glutamine-hydrolysing)